jgi:hypothetical protein|tara:strand:+ start:1493 stop:1873 length:381 start_codon:yes stop_codon:yes gene_type:complete
MTVTDRQLEKISGAILTSFINLHYLEEAKSTGLFQRRTKLNLNRTIEDLLYIETEYYNKVESVDDRDLSDKLTSNKIEFIKWLLNDFNFNDFCKIQEICKAFDFDREALTKTSDEILLKNGSVLIE